MSKFSEWFNKVFYWRIEPAVTKVVEEDLPIISLEPADPEVVVMKFYTNGVTMKNLHTQESVFLRPGAYPMSRIVNPLGGVEAWVGVRGTWLGDTFNNFLAYEEKGLIEVLD